MVILDTNVQHVLGYALRKQGLDLDGKRKKQVEQVGAASRPVEEE